MNNNSTHMPLSLADCLRQEIERTNKLVLFLDNEQEALSSLDETLITANTIKKQSLAESLQQASEKRINLMLELGIDPTSNGVSAFRESGESTDELEKLFTELSTLAEQCLSKNRVIGQLINRKTQFISKTLNSLSPLAELQGLTYAENGSTNKHDGLRNLGSI